jgi:nitric oxide reductase NorD protein
VVALESVRRRLELFLAALYNRPIAIEAADRGSMSGWFRRHVLHLPDKIAASNALAANNGERIFLPRALSAAQGVDHALDQYRLLALEQGERIARGTVESYPARDVALVRDLYLVSEGIAVDASLARTVPNVRPLLDRALATALADRPISFLLTGAEKEVETLVRDGLAKVDNPSPTTAAHSPADSVAWARMTAERIGVERRYASIRPVRHWGAATLGPQTEPNEPTRVIDDVLVGLRPPTVPIPGMRSYSSPDKTGSGPPALTTGDGIPSKQPVDPLLASAAWVPDPGGSSGETAPAAAGSESRPRQRASTSARKPVDDHASPTDADLGASAIQVGTPSGESAQYPEWDHVTETYRERAVTVHSADATPGDPAWAADVFREHAVLIRQVRERFDRLRASRLRSGQQLDGDELDIPACVRAAVDRRMGQTPDDRLYMTTQAARHPLAIALLADVSGSTKAVVTDPLRMIDIEKVALLIASEALSSLGDRHALFAFAGRGPHGVRVTTLKAFNEGTREAVRHRIAGLDAAGFTRLGAAVRHVTATLRREPARHRLLLVLSDGRPNDADQYMSEYGVEDSRQAMAEARARGVYPFCLNVDEEGAAYLVRIFGPAGYTSLRRPDQLPVALLQAVRKLIRS